jgi:hypothetical protein
VREPGGYATPAAFRRALTDRLKALASASRWPLPQLQRQIAYDRLLERLYLADDQWIVKGATALPSATSATGSVSRSALPSRSRPERRPACR